jgi:hypothetical protein
VLHPSHVRFRTIRARYGTSAWLTVDELSGEASWADVDARVRSKTSVAITTTGVGALSLARDRELFDTRAPLSVDVDGTSFSFAPGEPVALHKAAGGWTKGQRPQDALPVKGGHVTGPLRDVFHEPLLFVYGADEDARANERVAHSFASRPGIATSYPVMSDTEFLAANEPLANDRALFLVGRSNKVLAALESAAGGATAFPIHVQAGAVTIGKDRITGNELGAAFIHPNPTRSDRYVVIVAGADTAGTLRAMSLPDLLPDFAVWDERLAPARGQVVLGTGALRAGGFFKTDWSLPTSIADPLAAKVPKAAVVKETETAASPELPP